MNIDEAMTELQEMLEIYDPGHRKHMALDIALWLLERDAIMQLFLTAPTIEHAMVARTRLHDFESEHPRPGSEGA